MLAISLTGVGLVVKVPWALIDLLGVRGLVGRLNFAKAQRVAEEIRGLDVAPTTASPGG